MPRTPNLLSGNLMRLAVIAPETRWLQPRLVGGAPRAARQIPVKSDQMDLAAILETMTDLDLAQAWVWPGCAPIPDAQMVREAQRTGWDIQIAQPRSEQAYGAWVSALRPGSGVRQVYYPAADYGSPFFRPGPGVIPLHLLRALAIYTLAMGAFWYRSAPATGMAHMRAALRGHHYDLAATDLPTAMRDPQMHADGGMVWSRDLTERERAQGRYLVLFDRNGAWLAAAGMATLGAGTPVHITNDAHSNLSAVAKAGLFRLRMLDHGPIPARYALPLPLPDYSSERWVSKPTLDLITEWDGRFEIAEAYIQTQAHRALEPWYKRLRDARMPLVDPLTGDAAALDMFKQSYVKGLGMLGHGGGPEWDRAHDTLYRPDWYATLKALSRANTLRKGLNVARDSARSPFGLAVDCWYYLLEEPGQLDVHYALGRALNQWKRAVYDLADYTDLAAIIGNDALSASRRFGDLRRRLGELEMQEVAHAGR